MCVYACVCVCVCVRACVRVCVCVCVCVYYECKQFIKGKGSDTVCTENSVVKSRAAVVQIIIIKFM